MNLKNLKPIAITGLKIWAVVFIVGVLLTIYNFAATIIGTAIGSTNLTILLLISGLAIGILLLGFFSKLWWGWK